MWEDGILDWKLWPQQFPIYEKVRSADLPGEEIVMLCARQFGKCIEINSLVATPRGPVPIGTLNVGDQIYGYSSDGSVGLTKVVATERTGIKKLLRLGSRGREICSVTAEHRFLASWKDHKAAPRKQAVMEAGDLVRQRRKKFARVLIDAPLGKEQVADAYAVGAMIGNGCKSVRKDLLISSPDERVPQKVAGLLGFELRKAGMKNYTWVITSSHTRRGVPSACVQTACDSWFRNLYSHERFLDRAAISKWDRESCLKLLAGLTDTDGSVTLQADNTLRWSYATGSKRLAEDVQWLFYWLFGFRPGITEFSRLDAIEYTVFVISNLHVKRMLRQIDQDLVMEHKKYKPAYDGLNEYNTKQDYIGLQVLGEYEGETCDIQVDNDTNLYVLHDEGVITHNSHLGVLLALEDCLRFPNRCILIVGPTIKQATEIVAPRIRDIMRDAPEGLIRRSKAESKYYVGKSELVIGGFDISSSSQRGKTVQNIYIEEIVDSHPDDYMEAMRSDLGPALTHSDNGKMIFLTTPPKIPDHPFITETMVKAKLNGTFFKYTIDDNQALTRQQYDACVNRSGGRNTIDFRREYLCEIVRDTSIVVVPSFDPAKHVRPLTIPTKCKWHTSIDWGGVRDKTVAVLHTYDYLSDIDMIEDERVFDANTPTDVICREILAMEAGREVSRHADVPGQLLVDLTAAGFQCIPPIKDDWKAGINYVNVRFSLDKCFINPRCRFTIMSLESGVFNKHKTDFERTMTLGHCDAIAALMYGLRTRDGSNPYQVMQPRAYGDSWINTNVSRDTPSLEMKTFGQPKKFGVFQKKF